MMWNHSINKINELIKEKYFMGAVLSIHHNKEEVFFKSFGINSIKNNSDMNGNELFKIYSMSKPITVIALLKLVDNGVIDLDDYLYKYIPEFKYSKVLVNSTSDETEEIKNHIKLKHLLTMTSGITYEGNKFRTQKEIKNILKNIKTLSLQTFAKEISKVPLLFQPGTSWYYGMGIDIIGSVIERVSRQSLRNFVIENIFKPIGMFDSDFFIKDKALEAACYDWNYLEDKNVLTENSNMDFLFKDVYKENDFSLGGSGIISTARDYNLFLDMLLDGKNKNGDQIISKKLIDEMSQDNLKELKKFFRWTLNTDYSYGYGVRVRIKNEQYPLTSVGEFGWDGLLGSTGIVDKEKNITVTLMLTSKPGHNKLIESDFFDALYKDIKIWKEK